MPFTDNSSPTSLAETKRAREGNQGRLCIQRDRQIPERRHFGKAIPGPQQHRKNQQPAMSRPNPNAPRNLPLDTNRVRSGVILRAQSGLRSRGSRIQCGPWDAEYSASREGGYRNASSMAKGALRRWIVVALNG